MAVTPPDGAWSEYVSKGVSSPHVESLSSNTSSVPPDDMKVMTFEGFALPCFGLILFVMALLIPCFVILDFEPLSFDFEVLGDSLYCIHSPAFELIWICLP
ncbi:hypothetical protein Tco_0802595 [Tanacetum coccineum]|uniref:NADH dehydrogenase subunit 3 n=1 Tax=Tanacetum coccineum TaxID=301880 RepID=A0ABQ5A054_9ASTR